MFSAKCGGELAAAEAMRLVQSCTYKLRDAARDDKNKTCLNGEFVNEKLVDVVVEYLRMPSCVDQLSDSVNPSA